MAETQPHAEARWVVIGVATVAALTVAQLIGGTIRSVVTDEPTRLETVRTCLTERSVEYGEVQDDLLARTAAGGALATTVQGNPVIVLVEDSDAAARALSENYLQLGGPAALPRLELRRRVVLLWQQEPTASQREFMRLCTLDTQG